MVPTSALTRSDIATGITEACTIAEAEHCLHVQTMLLSLIILAPHAFSMGIRQDMCHVRVVGADDYGVF